MKRRLVTVLSCTAVLPLLAGAIVASQRSDSDQVLRTATSPDSGVLAASEITNEAPVRCAFEQTSLATAHSTNQVRIPTPNGSRLSVDKHEVTNLQFRQFTDATGYITVAERGLSIEGSSDSDAQQWQPGSAVFVQPQSIAEAATGQWWTYVAGANWKHPAGPGTNIDALDDHPVVHLAWEDVEAYAEWAGRRIPTSAEWEFAARYLESEDRRHWHRTDAKSPYTVSQPETDNDSDTSPYIANTWQGTFPIKNAAADGHAMTAPVGCYPALASGLHDMVGNVWEWVGREPATTSKLVGPIMAAAAPEEGQTVGLTHSDATAGEIRGGSFLCAPNFCMNYHPSAFLEQDLTLGTNHIGFRTVKTLTAN